MKSLPNATKQGQHCAFHSNNKVVFEEGGQLAKKIQYTSNFTEVNYTNYQISRISIVQEGAR